MNQFCNSFNDALMSKDMNAFWLTFGNKSRHVVLMVVVTRNLLLIGLPQFFSLCVNLTL